MANILILTFVYKFNEDLLNWFIAMFMSAFIVLDIAKQGVCKDGVILCFKGKQFYRWEEINIKVVDNEELLIIINDSVNFKFNINKKDRIIEILSENKLYFPASHE
ncbi:MAG: hypothetical protein ACI4WM_04440 [Erysipelotrichaceae bacterium]